MSTRNQFFDKQYFEVYGNDAKRLQMYCAEQLRIESRIAGGRILDVGCGIGAFLDVFPDERWTKFGVDVSEHAIEACRSKGIHVNDVSSAYSYPVQSFDVVAFRGSLQHLPCPFKTIQDCIELLRPGGWMVFLATPNTNSPYFRRFKTLPILTESVNILQPSDIMLRNALQNMGLEVDEIRYPYLETPYARPIRDHLWYGMSFIGLRRKFAFWGSAMEIFARKPGVVSAE